MKAIKLFIGFFLIGMAMNAQTVYKFKTDVLGSNPYAIGAAPTSIIGHNGKLVLGDYLISNWGPYRLQIYTKREGMIGMRLGNYLSQLKSVVVSSEFEDLFKANAGDIVLQAENYESDRGGNFRLKLKGKGEGKFISLGNEFRTALRAYDNEKIVIGHDYNFDSDADYLLYVGKGIKTEKIKVNIASENGWADYVFADDYQLRSLGEVEEYIEENKHLPEIPSTEEVMENGVELKEMTALLLKKVEELTLYTIEQEKKIEELKKELEEVKKK